MAIVPCTWSQAIIKVQPPNILEYNLQGLTRASSKISIYYLAFLKNNVVILNKISILIESGIHTYKSMYHEC